MHKNDKKLKPWSISTTVRNPERIRGFLQVLKTMEGTFWDQKSQTEFQIKLIQNKLYGAGSGEFYNNLPKEYIDLMELPGPISFDDATNIFNAKNYEDPPMRGRQSFNPIKKMGLAYLDKNKQLRVSSFGDYFLSEDYDIPEIFFRSFLKWQLPNPSSSDYKIEDGYNIKPFIGILHLIYEVNRICKEKKIKEKGVSRNELMLFGLTLIDYQEIRKTAKQIVDFREEYESLKDDGLKRNFFEKNKELISEKFIVKNLNDYTDNAIRYFKITRYIIIRGDGYYIDLEPRRMVEIKQLLEYDNASAIIFENNEKYENYLQSISLPVLPWEEKNNLIEVCKEILKQIDKIERTLDKQSFEYTKQIKIDISKLTKPKLIKYNSELRNYRRKLQGFENYLNLQKLEEIIAYRELLSNIYKTDKKKSIELERLVTLSMIALNDAIEVKPNYPVSDDNQPLFTAPANKPDIECYYHSFNAICEVTMLTDRQQWIAEGQPVMRHLRDFENKQDKDTYCIFVAPKLHRDTINTYWTAVKYEYEGKKQRIVPLTINQFLLLIDTLIERKKNNKMIYHKELLLLFNSILSEIHRVNNSDEWIGTISGVILDWQKRLTK